MEMVQQFLYRTFEMLAYISIKKGAERNTQSINIFEKTF